MAYIDRELLLEKIREKATTKFDWSEQIGVDDLEELIMEMPTTTEAVRPEVFALIESVLDTLVEVGNGVTDDMLHAAADKLFKVRSLLEGSCELKEFYTPYSPGYGIMAVRRCRNGYSYCNGLCTSCFIHVMTTTDGSTGGFQ